MPRTSPFICEVCLQLDPTTAVVQNVNDRRTLRIRFTDGRMKDRIGSERTVMTLCRTHQIAMARYLDGGTNSEISMSRKLAMLLIHAGELVAPQDEEVPF